MILKMKRSNLFFCVFVLMSSFRLYYDDIRKEASFTINPEAVCRSELDKARNSVCLKLEHDQVEGMIFCP